MAPKSKSVGDVALNPQAIDLISTPTSSAYSHIHPFLVLGVLYASFSLIVREPVTWLAYLLAPVAALQTFYSMLCVPASTEGRNTTTSAAPVKSAAGSRRKQKASIGTLLASRLPAAILSTLASFALTTVPIFALLVLHGAPITTHIPHTILLAMHISILSCMPLFYTHGVDADRWRTVYSLLAPIDEVMGAAIGTIIGAWLGAIPIPLDWDREWQKWPVTVIVGAYAGWAVGSRLGATSWMRGRIVSFD